MTEKYYESKELTCNKTTEELHLSAWTLPKIFTTLYIQDKVKAKNGKNNNTSEAP